MHCFRREIKRLASKPLYFVAIIIFPLFTLIFMATIFGNGQLDNLPIGIVDNSNSAESREIIRTISSVSTFNIYEKTRGLIQDAGRDRSNNPVNYYLNEKEAREAVQGMKIYGYIVIPPDFHKNMYNPDGATLTFYYHYAIIAVGGEIRGAFTNVLSQISASSTITSGMESGLSSAQIKSVVLPISPMLFPIYNSDLDFSVFLSYPFFFVFFQILILVFTVYIITSEKREGTAAQWIKSADGSKFKALFLKLLPYYIIFAIESIFATYIFFGIMHIPFSCGFLPLIISSVIFIASTMAIGVIICAIFSNIGVAMSMASMFGALGATTCGVTFPVESMYVPIQFLAHLFPIRYFTHIDHNLLYSDMSIGYSWHYFLLMSLFIFIPFLLAESIEKNIFTNIEKEKKEKGFAISAAVALIMIGGTVGYGFLYNIMYEPNIVTEIPVAVVDNSKTPLSREYISYLDATQNVKVSAILYNMKDAERLMKNHSVRGIVYLPYNFEKQQGKSEESTIMIYETTTSFLYYLGIQTGAVGAMNELNNSQRTKIASMLPIESKYAISQAPTINISGVPLYNHNGGYGSFLIPIVIIVILFQTMIMAMGVYIGENNGIKPKAALFFAVMYFLLSLFAAGLIPGIFDMPNIGSSTLTFSFLLLFIITTATAGLAFSPLFRERESVMIAIPFFSVGLIFLSGFSFPVEQMPDFWHNFSYLFPTTPAVRGYVKINSLGGNFNSIVPEIIALCLQLAIYTALYIIIRTSVNKEISHH